MANSTENVALGSGLPQLQEVGDVELPPNSVLVVAAGSEDRAIVALQTMRGLQNCGLILLTYTPDDPTNKVAECRVESKRQHISQRLTREVLYDRLHPDLFPESFADALRSLGQKAVCIDISAMSKLALMLILDVCREEDVDTTVFYVEAASYGPSEEEYAKARQSPLGLARPSSRFFAGVQDVVRAARLSSVAMQGQPSAAIVFMSFNELLTQALIDNVCPARLLLINGRPPLLSWREAATAWIHEELRRDWPVMDNPLRSDGLPVRSTSTLDYRETVSCLLELYWRLSDSYRILLAPTGSKFQALACSLVKAIHPDIHVEYPVPQGDLNLRGIGVSRQWLLHLGRLGTTCTRLALADRKNRLQIALT